MSCRAVLCCAGSASISSPSTNASPSSGSSAQGDNSPPLVGTGREVLPLDMLRDVMESLLMLVRVLLRCSVCVVTVTL